VRERSFLNRSYYSNTRFTSAWGKEAGELAVAAHQLLSPLAFHRTKPARQGARIQSKSSAGHSLNNTLPAKVWWKESS